MLYAYDKATDQLVPAGELAYYGPAGRAIGELVWALLPVRAAGFQLLDGSLIYSTGIYAAFYNYIVQLKNTGEHDNLFITETEWQDSVTQYGVCGKFVLDTTAGTVRIPKVTGHVEGTIDSAAVGTLIEAGLPNITGSITNSESGTAAQFLADSSVPLNVSGSLYVNSYSTRMTIGNGTGSVDTADDISIDGSLSSPIYGNSTTVQTQSIKGYLYMIVGTYAKSDLQVNIDNVASDLSHQGARITIVEDRVHIVETWQSDDGTSWYRKWSDGWIEQGGIANISGTAIITLPIAFTSDVYSTLVTTTVQDNYGFNDNHLIAARWGNKTLSSFGVAVSYIRSVTPSVLGNSDVNWYACGY